MLKIKPLPLPVKKTKTEKNSNLNSLQLRQDFLSAIKRYQNATGSGKFSRKRLIYSKPWFLVCGPTDSGKSTLLNKTGLNWIASYPDEADEQLQWRFANEAVWIDIPGSLLEDTAASEFQVFLETLAWIRGRRPLDGILFVTDCGELLDAELINIKYKGESLRRRIDQIIKLWGIELPLYHIFSNADKITGFNTLFSDPAGKWNERILGATINSTADKNPKDLFLDELGSIVELIKEIQVKMLARDQNQSNRRLICQFPIMFESLREKISSLISIIYKKSEHSGKPLFGGFFFTSCQSEEASVPDTDDRIFDVSKTIISHPLNPNRKRAHSPHNTHPDGAGSYSCYFASPLFTSIIPGHAAPISTTEQKFRQNLTSLIWKIAAALVVIITFSVLEWSAAARVSAIDKKMRSDFSIPVVHSGEGIKQLGNLLQDYYTFKKYARHRTFSMFITRYDAKSRYEKIRDAFFSSVFSSIILPCSNELSLQQTRLINLSENSPENDFLKLKHLLQTYLSISDSNHTWSGVFDNKIVVPILKDMAVTSIFGVPNVTSGLDTIMKNVISEYVSQQQKNTCPEYRIKTNENLVRSVQNKLVTMFDVNAVYGLAYNELLLSSKNLELIDIVGNDVTLNLRSTMTLNEVYTPAGWTGNVQKKFREASRLREHIEDWVIGDNKSAFSGVFSDPGQLYNGLVQRYSEDVKTQWRNFLNSISMERFGTFQIGQERLLQESGAQSDIAKLIGTFALWSAGFTKIDSGKASEPAFLSFTEDMSFLRQFVGAGLPQYQKQFEEVAKGLAKSFEENSVLGVFTGRDGDPLLGTYQFINNSVLLPLSKDQKSILEHLLMEPYSRTVELLKPELVKNLSVKWKEIFDWFDGSFSRLYPFSDGNKEASFDAVLDFFNPVTGTLWKSYNDHFSPYLTRNRTINFECKNSQGLIPVKFTPAFLKCLDKADTISTVFFKDGKRKTWKITILPKQTAENKKIKNAIFTFGKESVNLLTEPGKSLKWPVEEGVQNGKIELTNTLDLKGTYMMTGQWSFMNFINKSYNQAGPVFSPGFSVKLVTVHNSRTLITIESDIAVSSSSPQHPFCHNVLKGFSVPKVIF